MGLQKEWEKAESTEEAFKVKFFTDDLTILYQFESRKFPNKEIEVWESFNGLRVQYRERK